MRVLVVGATGAMGRHVVAKLLSRGVDVRALTRSPERAVALTASGAEVVVADLIDAASLIRACAGVDRVLAAAHGLLGKGTHSSEQVDGLGHRALISAALGAGVSRFVYVSARGASPTHPVDFFRTKHSVEQALAASGLEYVVLRPTAFMEQHVHLFNGAALLSHGKTKLIGPGTKKRNFVAATDVAELAVRALLDDPLPFRVLEVGGPGNYSDLEVLALYADKAGIRPRASHLPVFAARLMSLALRRSNPGLARILKLKSLADDAHPERFDGASALRQACGLDMTTLESFVAARIAEHRQRPN